MLRRIYPRFEYHPGYWQARVAIRTMTVSELLDYLDRLFGRDNLPSCWTQEDLVLEALRQCEIEWRK